MKSVTRVLGPNDREELIKLANKTQGVMFIDDDLALLERLQLSLDRFLDPKDTKKILFGYFYQSTLVATVGMSLWERMPFWTMNQMRTNRDFHAETTLQGLSSCVTAMVEYGLSQNYFRYYFVQAMRYRTFKSHHATALQRITPILRRFTFRTEAVIPRNTRPKFDYEWNILGRSIYPKDLVIRSGTLEEKDRIEFFSKNYSDISIR